MEKEIRFLTSKDLPAALALVEHVFMLYEAPDYTQEGVQEFLSFISLPRIQQKLQQKEMFFLGCFTENILSAVLGFTPPGHINLLFTHEKFFRQGIARRLLSKIENFAKEEYAAPYLTVNASPYAIEAYKRLGFLPTDVIKTVNGITFLPMQKTI
ncbi:MAG: GNAT family N-acetyltransferase [Christensenellaceae bacterium]|jgi:GNAT superfamily N-acetyltransferase